MNPSHVRLGATILACLLVFVFFGPAGAEIPQLISYQGKVTDSGGTPVADGTYTMRFRIYDAAAGGALEWDSGDRSIAVSDGVFNVFLGESPQPTLDLSFDEDYWLLVTFDGVNQSPRQRLTSAGYAYMASGLVPGTLIEGSVTDGTNAAIKGVNTGGNYGVYGKSTVTWGMGVIGFASAFTGETYGVHGQSASTSGKGVYGHATAHTGTTYGVYGFSNSTSGAGVRGYASAATGPVYGGKFKSNSTSGKGVYGEAPHTGVYGKATATTGEHYGGSFASNSSSGRGVSGYASATTGLTYGVYGWSRSTSGKGVYGEAPYTGVYGKATATTGTNYGLSVTATSGWAGWFAGDVNITGMIQKGSGSFLIDHPLDPENKLLRHNFVESPENLLIYRGTVKLDSDGEALVEMPEYFEALTKENEASVHLTPEGKPFLTGYRWQADHTAFTAYGDPNREVAWMVMADRDDPVMHQLARPVEEDKGPDNKVCDRGELLYPTAYGYPKTMGRDHKIFPPSNVHSVEEPEDWRPTGAGEPVKPDRPGVSAHNR